MLLLLLLLWSLGGEVVSGVESRRGMMGSCSHCGRGAARRVLDCVSGEGWAWRRRWVRWRQVGRGTELIFWVVLV